MKLFIRGCASTSRMYVAAVGELSARDWSDVEAHAHTCAECADALRDAIAAEVALTRAFAPLRSRRASLAPGRVRMALGPARDLRRSTWLRAPALFGRLAEVSVALGVALFAVTSSLGPTQETVAPHPRSVIQEYFRSQPPTDELDYFRWLRLQPTSFSGASVAQARLPVGGRFDVDPVEIFTNPNSTPR